MQSVATLNERTTLVVGEFSTPVPNPLTSVGALYCDAITIGGL